MKALLIVNIDSLIMTQIILLSAIYQHSYRFAPAKVFCDLFLKVIIRGMQQYLAEMR